MLLVSEYHFNDNKGSEFPMRGETSGDETKKKTEQVSSLNMNHLDKMKESFVTIEIDDPTVRDNDSFNEEDDIESPVTGNAFSLHRQKSSKNRHRFMDEVTHLEMANLVLGMERTLFAALNNAWLLAIGGIGLMSVGGVDIRATNMGIVIVSFSILCAFKAGSLHYYRIHQLRRNQSFLFNQTLIWVFFIVSFSVVALSVELHYGILYPYLDRENAVKVVNDDLL